jgi:hypothetical protein
MAAAPAVALSDRIGSPILTSLQALPDHPGRGGRDNDAHSETTSKAPQPRTGALAVEPVKASLRPHTRLNYRATLDRVLIPRSAR